MMKMKTKNKKMYMYIYIFCGTISFNIIILLVLLFLINWLIDWSNVIDCPIDQSINKWNSSNKKETTTIRWQQNQIKKKPIIILLIIIIILLLLDNTIINCNIINYNIIITITISIDWLIDPLNKINFLGGWEGILGVWRPFWGSVSHT